MCSTLSIQYLSTPECGSARGQDRYAREEARWQAYPLSERSLGGREGLLGQWRLLVSHRQKVAEASQDTASRVSILLEGFEDSWAHLVATKRQGNSRRKGWPAGRERDNTGRAGCRWSKPGCLCRLLWCLSPGGLEALW